MPIYINLNKGYVYISPIQTNTTLTINSLPPKFDSNKKYLFNPSNNTLEELKPFVKKNITMTPFQKRKIDVRNQFTRNLGTQLTSNFYLSKYKLNLSLNTKNIFELNAIVDTRPSDSNIFIFDSDNKKKKIENLDSLLDIIDILRLKRQEIINNYKKNLLLLEKITTIEDLTKFEVDNNISI